jgi:hypothetical protein
LSWKQRKEGEKVVQPEPMRTKWTKTDIQGSLFKEHSSLSSKVENGIAREDGTFQESIVVHR